MIGMEVCFARWTAPCLGGGHKNYRVELPGGILQWR
jgi:hypothetical protein